MRLVQHLAIETQGARVRIFFEKFYHRLGMRDFLIARGKRLIDDRDLIRMNRNFPGISVPPRIITDFAQSFIVAKVGQHSVYRLHAGGMSGKQT